MSRSLSRLARLALLFGLIGLESQMAEAANIGANLNVRTQNFPQATYAGGRNPHVGLGTGTAGAPAPSYGGPGLQPRSHLYDRSTQFNGTGDSSANTKLK